MLPFLIGMLSKDATEGAMELALHLQRALDYHIDYFGFAGKRFIVGALIVGDVLTFYTMAKTEHGLYEQRFLGSYRYSDFASTILACQVIGNLDKLAQAIYTSQGGYEDVATPSTAAPSPDMITRSRAEMSYPLYIYAIDDNNPILSKTEHTVVRKAHNAQQGRAMVIKRTRWAGRPNQPLEIDVLNTLHGENRTLRLFQCFASGDDETGAPTYSCVFQYIEHKNVSTSVELKLYMKHLMRAIAHCHKRGVMHRGVKQSHTLRDAQSGETTLIGFGHAVFIGQPKYDAVSIDRYCPPELDEICGQSNFSFAGDIWSAGVVFLELLMGLETPTEPGKRYAISDIIDQAKQAHAHDPSGFAQQKPLFSEEGLLLAEKMLLTNRWKRLSAQGVLGDVYFFD